MANSANDPCSSTIAEETANETIARMLSNFVPTSVPYSGWPYVILAEIRTFPTTDAAIEDGTQEQTPSNWTHSSWDPENETPTNQLKLAWMYDWFQFHEQHQSMFNTWKLSIFIDVPWILFDNVNRVRFEMRPMQEVTNIAAEENRLRLPVLEGVEIPGWLDDFLSNSEAEINLETLE